ncbi:hypothetical protein D9615_010460 [Tricholomella constricta]|uniref:Retrotransposon gag domain-containing protein n=1 Tax=Tricholomella constricta TaxID=117010 RepID=A0A8H5GLS8_9AGAR|nr:hypothetical protein D9615_010460 [Tricholomella constricta]
MATTSVVSDFNLPAVPPPTNPDIYNPVPTYGIDYAHLPGTLDPAAIPGANPGPNIVPGQIGSVPINQPAPNTDFSGVINMLAQNQSTLQATILDVMAEVARRPVVQAAPPALSNPPPRGNSIKLRNARIFNGKHSEVTPFISEIKRLIEFNASSFPDDHTKVLFVGLNLKDGIPIEWFNHLEHSESSLLWNFNNFLAAFRKKFADPSLITTADQRLDQLKQTGSVHYYLTSFMEIASHLDMTEQTKISRFMKGLKPIVKDALVMVVHRPTTLEEWELLVISIDTNLHQREVERKIEEKLSGGKKKKDWNYNTSNSATYVPPNSKQANSSTPNQPNPVSTSDFETALVAQNSCPYGPRPHRYLLLFSARKTNRLTLATSLRNASKNTQKINLSPASGILRTKTSIYVSTVLPTFLRPNTHNHQFLHPNLPHMPSLPKPPKKFAV